ncbi:MAG: 2-C-methyl-D-erythritol 2,4-cyclodiphosphate synthase [Gammaproteobacteria bacterium]
MDNLRIGFGFDAHQIKKGSSMVIGGIKIDSDYEIIAHSDGDVLTHAICDALLGAAHLGDLGSFVPEDNSTKNISSLKILEEVIDKLRSINMEIINIDSTYVGSIPRLEPYKADMEIKLASILKIDSDLVSCKATTTDGLSYQGKKEGISAYATVLLKKIK